MKVIFFLPMEENACKWVKINELDEEQKVV